MEDKHKRVVLDASVVIKWVINDKYTEHALRLRDDHLDGRVDVYAPDLLLAEVGSALRKYVIHGILNKSQAEEALKLIIQSGIKITSAYENNGSMLLDAMNLSLELGVTYYDALYLALARMINAPFYTANEKLLANPEIARKGIPAYHISEYL
ncbi:MAG: type II toxin-antitoxin system VapC family toxin [Desulfurococcales archaeon]|nr:type II toxin-antitoxin system VapC family toxin [Desulfurococcales archaeon]